MSAEPVEAHILMPNPLMCEGLSERPLVEDVFGTFSPDL